MQEDITAGSADAAKAAAEEVLVRCTALCLMPSGTVLLTCTSRMPDVWRTRAATADPAAVLASLQAGNANELQAASVCCNCESKRTHPLGGMAYPVVTAGGCTGCGWRTGWRTTRGWRSCCGSCSAARPPRSTPPCWPTSPTSPATGAPIFCNNVTQYHILCDPIRGVFASLHRPLTVSHWVHDGAPLLHDMTGSMSNIH